MRLLLHSATEKSAVLIVVFCCLPAAAQDWTFTQYNQPEALSDMRVSDVAQDAAGRIWAASWGMGVVMTDAGVHEVFDNTDGLPSDWTYGVIGVADGSVWCASPDGISHIRDRVLATYTKENTPSLPANEVWCLSRLPDGMLAAGVGKGYVLEFDPAHPEQPWAVLATPDEIGAIEVHDLLQTPDGDLWAAAETMGLWHKSPAGWERILDPALHPTDGDGFMLDNQGGLYVFGDVKVAKREFDHWLPLPDAPAPVLCMRQSADGQIYAGTEKGLYRFNAARGWLSIHLGRDLGIPYVKALLIDDRDMLWLACYEGLIQGVRPPWERFRRGADRQPLVSGPFAGAPDVPPYAFDKQGQLLQFQGGVWTPLARFEGISPVRIRLSKAHPEQLWVLTASEVVFIDLAARAISARYPVSAAQEADDFFETADGLFCLVSLTGLYTIENGEWRLLPKDDTQVHGGRVTGITQARDGTIYLCTENEAYRWTAEEFESLNGSFPQLRDQHFLDVMATSNGEVWFATSGEGIFVMRGAQIENITRANGLPSDRIAKQFEASDGTIWVCSRRRGISSFRDGRWIHYETRHGLPNDNAESFCESPKGVIWFSTLDSGIYRYEPHGEPPSTTILSGPRDIGYRRNGMFWLSGRDAWDRTKAAELTYSWRLVPVSEAEQGTGWSPFSPQTVVVTTPPGPGKYVFEARTSDLDRNVDPAPAVMLVTVAPPLWRMPAFLVPTSLLSVIALCAVLAWFRVQRAEERAKRALEVSAASLENAQRIAHLGNWEWDVASGRIQWSAELYRIFGLDGTLHPTAPLFMQSLHPGDRERVDECFAKAVGEHAPPNLDHRIVRPDGEIRHVHVQGELVFDAEGSVVRVFGTTADITDRKLNEEERDRLIAELRKALKDVRTLSGLVPICANCKNIRDDQGYWQRIESYVRDRSYAEFSHSICPDCAEQLYGDRSLGDHK